MAILIDGQEWAPNRADPKNLYSPASIRVRAAPSLARGQHVVELVNWEGGSSGPIAFTVK